jgi:hypothetical protein
MDTPFFSIIRRKDGFIFLVKKTLKYLHTGVRHQIAPCAGRDQDGVQ